MQRFRTLWETRDDAGHRHTDAAWMQFYGAELLLFAPPDARRVVEVGCGRGDLYPAVARVFPSYVGFDFSPAMISAFHRDHPDAAVACADATALPVPDATADFVFSNQVAQYLDADALRVALGEAWRILRAGGTCLVGNIPDAHLRWAYWCGALRSEHRPSLGRFVRAAMSVGMLRRGDAIGLWHRRHTVASIASAIGFDVRTYSSPAYEYRFHAVLTKSRAKSP